MSCLTYPFLFHQPLLPSSHQASYVHAWAVALSQTLLRSNEARYWGMLVVLSALNLLGFALLVGRMWHLERHAQAVSNTPDTVSATNPLLSRTDVAAFLDDAKAVLATSPIVYAADVAQDIRLPLLQHRH